MFKRKPLISIIFPAKNEGDNVKTTLDSLFSVKVKSLFEAVVVNDGSEDKCCDFIHSYPHKDRVLLIDTKGAGAAKARNLGAKNASGEILIFCDAHLQFENWWIDHLIEPLKTGKTDAVTPGIASSADPSIIGYGQTLTSRLETRWNLNKNTLFETPIIPGGCFAISKTVFNKVGGFEQGFRTWGYEDIEFSIKLWLFGYRCHAEPRVSIIHLFREKQPYIVRSDDVTYNLLRMAYLHFNDHRIQKCLNLINMKKSIRRKLLNDQSDLLIKRQTYFNERVYNDGWYFNKFNIQF